MTGYIKFGSDRPDFRTTLDDPEQPVVELTDAASVSFLMWGPDGNLLISDTAEVEESLDGVVRYDFSRDQIAAVGTNVAEVRVDWDDGDKQWFPIDQQAYEIEVVRAPGDRAADLADIDPTLDIEVGSLTVNGTVDDPDGTVNFISSVGVDGDLDVTGTLSFGQQALADGETITFGTDDDYALSYDTTLDAWLFADAINGVDALRVTRGGSGTADLVVGDGASKLYDHSEDHVGADLVDATSLDLSITPTWTGQHRFDAGLDTRGDIVHDAVIVYNATDQEIPEGVLPTSVTTDEQHTINSGSGLTGGATLTGDDSLTLAIEPADFAGTGLADDGTDNLQIQDGGVTGTQLANASVDTTQLANLAVTSAKLADGAVATAKLATDAVETGNIATDAVTTPKLATGAVEAGNIADSAVTTSKIATGAVEADEVATDAIRTSELDLSISPTWTGAHDFTGTLQAGGSDVLTTDDQSVVVDTTVTLAGGSTTVSTGVSSGHIDVSLDPSGGGANTEDVKVAARAVWNNTAGEYEVEVVEDGTEVGNPDVGVKVVQN